MEHASLFADRPNCFGLGQVEYDSTIEVLLIGQASTLASHLTQSSMAEVESLRLFCVRYRYVMPKI